MRDVYDDERKPNIFISFSVKTRLRTGALRLQYLLDTAPRPRIWETNIQTDPATGDTDIVLQFQDGRPQAFSLTLDDWEELQQRMDLSIKKAGFGL